MADLEKPDPFYIDPMNRAEPVRDGDKSARPTPRTDALLVVDEGWDWMGRDTGCVGALVTHSKQLERELAWTRQEKETLTEIVAAQSASKRAKLPSLPPEIQEWCWHLDLHLTEHDDRHRSMALKAAWPHIAKWLRENVGPSERVATPLAASSTVAPDDLLERMLAAFDGYQSALDRGHAQRIEGMRAALVVAAIPYIEPSNRDALPMPSEVWVVCCQTVEGKMSTDFVADYREAAMEHAADAAGRECTDDFKPFKVARYVLAEPPAQSATAASNEMVLRQAIVDALAQLDFATQEAVDGSTISAKSPFDHAEKAGQILSGALVDTRRTEIAP